MFITDLDSLIEAYHFVKNKAYLEPLKLKVDELQHLYPKQRLHLIEQELAFQKTRWIHQMKIKKVRKLLLNSSPEKVMEFNEKLKVDFPKKKNFISFKSMDHWVNEVLQVLVRETFHFYVEVEKIAGLTEYERGRLDSDLRIVEMYYYTTAAPGWSSDTNWEPEFTKKYNCICKKDVSGEGFNPFIRIKFTSGQTYQYRQRRKTGAIHVYSDETHDYVFEGESFYEYFNSPLSRERVIDQILN